MIIPESVGAVWSGRAKNSNKDLLDTMFEFMEFYDELNHGDIMQAYKEAADYYKMPAERFRYKFSLVLRFREQNLYEWFENGVSFYHLEKSSVAEFKQMTPAELVSVAIEMGGPTGKTMTVDEMVSFALGEKPSPAKKGEFRFFNNLEKFCNMKQWTPEKSERFQKAVRKLIDEFEKEESELK